MDFAEVIRQIRAKDPRYKAQAYELVRLGLDQAQKDIHGEPKKGKAGANRHVTGPQLLEGFRRHVLETYGPMSYPLLQSWGLRKSLDVGHIVFNIIDTGLFGRWGFEGVYSCESSADCALGYRCGEVSSTCIRADTVETDGGSDGGSDNSSDGGGSCDSGGSSDSSSSSSSD